MAAFVGVSALSTARVQRASVSRSSATVVRMAKSQAIPFLEKPDTLDGSLAGDAGFDPLRLSKYLNLKYLRAAELKHGRICMLATLGWVVQEIVRLPGPMFQEKHALQAIYKVPLASWVQIIAFISIIELVTFRSNYDDSSAPGDYGFDPLNLGKSGVIERYQLNEIKNGRLAMIAFMGFLFQQLVTGQGVIEQLANFKSV
uniref:Light-harvesting complex protein n=1 Tax=Erythrolobus australicus TaxID=1077150 RepID=A0A7S1TMR6_9RHOD